MKILPVFLLICCFAACNSPEEEVAESIADEEVALDTITAAKTMYNPETQLYIWKSDFDYTKKKNPVVNESVVVADSLIKGLNELYENVYLEKVQQSNDTLYTKITDSKYLTQQMGNTGAEVYLADVVLNLTEVPGIHYVNIDLKEGDHMQPGTWSKQSFEKYKTVK